MLAVIGLSALNYLVVELRCFLFEVAGEFGEHAGRPCYLGGMRLMEGSNELGAAGLTLEPRSPPALPGVVVRYLGSVGEACTDRVYAFKMHSHVSSAMRRGGVVDQAQDG